MSSKCVRLQTAAFKGDWEYVQLQNYPQDKLTSKITDKGETALHISAAAGKFLFVESLVNHLKLASQFLETENDNGNTALCYAAVSGDVSIAKLMLEAHAREAVVRAGNGYNPLANCGKVKPLSMAALLGRCEMVEYLMGVTEIEVWSGEERVELFINCINIGLCGEALLMLEKYKDLATARNKYNETGFLVLARNPCVFVPQSRPSWRTYIGLCDDSEDSILEAIDLVRKLYNLSINNPDLEGANRVKEVARALFTAAEKGNVDFIIELIRLDPDLIWKHNTRTGTIFHIAIQNRHETIFNLLSELGSFQDLIASTVVDGDRNMLHLAAQLAPQEQLNMVSGAALQMQRELLWFKQKVEKIVQPAFKEMKNSKHKTPHTLFTERHKTLMAEGEKWMKETAKSSMVVAALIATVMFTTAFTVPGGYNNNSGEPILENQRSFFIFSVADALALFCSSTSILMFHSILTSRYTETDFLESLPFRLMVGVTALFVSVAAMMVAFCATFFLYYPKEKVPWMFGLSAIFACVPSMYVSLKYPLLLDLVQSTHASRFMFQSQRQLFL